MRDVRKASLPFRHLLVEKVDVAPDVTLRFTASKETSVQARETHGEGHTKSKIGTIFGPTKWTLIQQKIFKKT